MNTGLLIIRVAVGVTLTGHGTQKLLGWWNGPGLTAAGELFDAFGHRPGRAMAFVAGATETTSGLLLAVGLGTPLASAMAAGVMAVAAEVSSGKGFWNVNGGYEYPAMLAVASAALGFTGPGRFSLDHALGLARLGRVPLGWAAAGLAASAAGATIARRHAVLTTDRHARGAVSSTAGSPE